MDAETARAIEQLAQSVRNLDARLRDVANFRPKLQAWQTPTLLNSWTNFGSGYSPAGYWKDPHGTVYLRGVVVGGAVNTVVFTLPLDYRPEFTTANFSFGIDQVDVQTDGDVLVHSHAQGGGTVVLEAMIFRAHH